MILKLATQRRPAGFMDADSGTGKRVVNQQGDTQQVSTAPAQTPSQTTAQAPVKAQTPQEAIQQATRSAAQTQTQQPSTQAASPQPVQTGTGGSKTARIRYVVPPIARPMDLRIEITDPAGKRDVMNKQVRSGETINTTAKYTNECVITIYLGGDFVWQERQK